MSAPLDERDFLEGMDFLPHFSVVVIVLDLLDYILYTVSCLHTESSSKLNAKNTGG
jgi:hypothetical protein